MNWSSENSEWPTGPSEHRIIKNTLSSLISVPEQGQLAEVRRRRYVVSDVKRSAVPENVVSPGQAQHLVSLVSIEDGPLGEELRVI